MSASMSSLPDNNSIVPAVNTTYSPVQDNPEVSFFDLAAKLPLYIYANEVCFTIFSIL